MRVLIVDDTHTLRSLIQVYLVAHGWEFVEAQDGAEGLAKARLTKPDLVISDVGMPVMDGFELCAAIRGDPVLRQVPVVLLTMLEDETSRQRGLLVGADAFLTKPVTPAELRKTIGAVMQVGPR
jgi:DNA-binding response OmpR family regulator